MASETEQRSPSTTVGQPGSMLLEAQQLRKTYQLGRVRVPVLHGASLNIARGEWVAVLGSSGSGKSTLLHLMGGLDRPDPESGRIAFEGRDIADFGERQRNRYRNRSIGFVFQFYHLLPELNVLENTIIPSMVGLGRLGWYTHRSDLINKGRQLLSQFGLEHRLQHRPRELSGGERQRVAIARALINEPQLLLADEPTGNLDVKTGNEILDLLQAQHESGLTIAMVTHDRSIADRADRSVLLEDGQVVESG